MHIHTSDRHKAASIEGDIHVEHCTHTVDDRRVNDGNRRVEVAPDLTAGALKVKHRRSFLLVDLDS